ncbi:MAG TPA: hypothetical protein VJB06_03985 [archaeon]|nr:hypothetical protein [archaeon]
MVSRRYSSEFGGRLDPFSDDLETLYRKHGFGSQDRRAKIDLLTEMMPGTREVKLTYPTERIEEIERNHDKPRGTRIVKIPAGGIVRIVGLEENLGSVDPEKVWLDYLEISYGICRGARNPDV